MQKILNLSNALKSFMIRRSSLLLLLVVPLLSIQFGGGMALADSFKSDACSGLTSLSSSQGCGTGSSDVAKLVNAVVNIVSVIVGALAIIFVIVAGYKYVTSSGDAQKVSSAKGTLIYALVGVAVAALAQLLTHTVLNTASSVGK